MVRWKSIFLAVSILAVVFSGYVPALAQSTRGAGGSDPRMEQGIDMMFRDMDSNRDGKISRSEWSAAQNKQFNRLNANGDGFVTKDEVRKDMDRMREEHMQMMREGRTPE